MTQTEAEALWSELREAMTNTERVIIEIIETEAWLPLGYDTFAQAWNDRMKGFRLATQAMRVHVVYALFSAGLDENDVRDMLGPQVGDEVLSGLRRQYENETPAEFATTVVRRHYRAKPGERETLHVKLSSSELNRFHDIAARNGLSVEYEAARAIRARFRELERARAA